MFTKNDLQTGDILIRRNGETGIVLKELGYIINKDFTALLSNTLEDLTLGLDSTYDIMKVYRGIHKQTHFGFKNFTNGELVFDRERDWVTPIEMTISEIEEKLGIKKIKIIK